MLQHGNFYPRPLRGGRLVIGKLSQILRQFLSTPSARRATEFIPPPSAATIISIHALCEEGDLSGQRHICPEQISIHALCEEGDHSGHRRYLYSSDFYPRPLRGGRPLLGLAADRLHQFLSTPSARRATAKTETKSLFSNKLYNILHEFRRALIYNGSKSYPNHAK